MTTATLDRRAEYIVAWRAPGPPSYADMVWIPGGTTHIGVRCIVRVASS